jgi:hypothetical protein
MASLALNSSRPSASTVSLLTSWFQPIPGGSGVGKLHEIVAAAWHLTGCVCVGGAEVSLSWDHHVSIECY